MYLKYIIKTIEKNFNTVDESNKKKISQTMSWILRHGINELGLKMDSMGRIPLEVLLGQKQLKQLGKTLYFLIII